MFLHKYVVDGEKFYRLCKGQQPGKQTVMIRQQDWKDMIQASKINNYLENIEEKFKEDKTEKKVEKTEKKAIVSKSLRDLARTLTK